MRICFILLPLLAFAPLAGMAQDRTSGPSSATTATATDVSALFAPNLTPIGPNTPLSLWDPYGRGTTGPLLSKASQETLDTTYAPEIAKARRGSPAEKRAAAELLAKGADGVHYADTRLALALRHEAYLLAAAGNAPLAYRAQLVRAIATRTLTGGSPDPLNRTLVALRLRAEALSALIKDAGTSATPALFDQAAAFYLRLAVATLHVGQIKEAATSLAAAKPWAEAARDKNRLAHLAAVTEYVNRATQASVEYARCRKALLANSADRAPNAQIAVLFLAVFADLDGAFPFAQNSGRPDLERLAKAAKARSGLPVSLYDRRTWATSLEITDALREVAEATKHPLDRYVLASWALGKAEALRATHPMDQPPADAAKLVVLTEKLRRLVKDRPASLPEYKDPEGVPLGLLKASR